MKAVVYIALNTTTLNTVSKLTSNPMDEQIECKQCKQIKSRIYKTVTKDGKTKYYVDSSGSYWQSPRICPECHKDNRNKRYASKRAVKGLQEE